MSKRIDNQLKRIKNNRVEMLNTVRNSLQQEGRQLSDSIGGLIELLNIEDKNSRTLTSLLKIQNDIDYLSIDVANCSTSEDIINVRKKINNCLNRVKKEIKARNLTEEQISEFQNNTRYLRNDIAKSLRAAKRKEKLEYIEQLVKYYEEIDDETKISLRKELRNETAFNHRNTSSKVKTKTKKSKLAETVIPNQEDLSGDINLDGEIPSEADIPNQEDLSGDINLDGEIPSEADIPNQADLSGDINLDDEIPLEADIPNQEEQDNQDEDYEERPNRIVFPEDNFSSISDYLIDLIERYESTYGVSRLYEYDGDFLERLQNFFKNIPLYIGNKHAKKRIEREFFYVTKGELIGYAAYLRDYNSILSALKKVFSRTSIYSRYGELKDREEQIADFIVDFCERNNLSINYDNSRVKTLTR